MITVALIGWPILIVILALRMSWPVTVAVALFGGYLLLPNGQGINLPLLPSFNKNTLPILTLVLLALILRPGKVDGPLPQAMPAQMIRPGWVPTSKLGMALLGLWIAGAILTALTNDDTLTYGGRSIQGMSLYDGFAILMSSLGQILPLLLARRYFAHPEMHKFLVMAFAVAAMLYSLPTLYEIRMSPQLSNMIYGFFPHDWLQHTRDDGFRPVVFLGHGLQLSIFMALGMLAAFGVMRLAREGSGRMAGALAGLWLLGTVFLTKSLGAFLIGTVMLPVVVLFSRRMQLLAAAAVAALVLSYPMLRSIDLVPTERLVSVAAQIDANRARSLAYRFGNEDALLERASERRIFGWGGWGRNRVYNEEGQSSSVTDGSWVIAFGTGGWAEYLSKFGLLTLPIMILAVRGRRYEASSATAIVCVILAANAVDLLPNSSHTSITWLMAGALLGRLELGRMAEEDGAEADLPDLVPPTPHGGAIYTRQTQRHVRGATRGPPPRSA